MKDKGILIAINGRGDGFIDGFIDYEDYVQEYINDTDNVATYDKFMIKLNRLSTEDIDDKDIQQYILGLIEPVVDILGVECLGSSVHITDEDDNNLDELILDLIEQSIYGEDLVELEECCFE